MSREKFIEQLESLLSPISAQEREEALQYYQNYFEDAGKEKEAEVLEELGTPEDVAKIIFDEVGYQEEAPKRVEEKKEETENQLHQGTDSVQNTPNEKPKMGKARKIIMICTSFIWAPILFALWIVIVTLIIVSAALAFTFAVLAVAFVVLGLAAFVYGFIHMITLPAFAISLVGAGFIILALAILFVLFVLLFVMLIIPGLSKLLVLSYTLPFKVKGEN